MTHSFVAGVLICELACLVWILSRNWAGTTGARHQFRSRSKRTFVPRVNAPLVYTSEASAQRVRHGLNSELVETALAFPIASGAVARTGEEWFTRDFGRMLIRVWASDSQGHGRRVITRIDVNTRGPL